MCACAKSLQKIGQDIIARYEPGQGDMKSTGLRAGEEIDRATWSRRPATLCDGKAKGKEEECLPLFY